MRFFLWSIVLAIAAIITAGCGEKTTTTHAGQQVPVVQEFKGQQGPFPDRGYLVVQDQLTWAALWGSYPAPTVDFTNNSVLVALMGRQPTGGYDIKISDVRATGTQIVAYITTTTPRPAEPVSQVITYPYDMVVVPKLSQPVIFNEERASTQPLGIQREFVGQQSLAVNPQTAVIRDPVAWRTFWANTFGTNVPVPDVNFDQYMATVVLLGRKPTAGYSVFITGAVNTGQRIDVMYRTIAPAPGEQVAQVITSPYAIALLPANAQAVAFRPVTTVTTVATAR